MSRRRPSRQTRRTSGQKAKLVWIGFCISVLLLVLIVTPSASYNVAKFGRQSGVDVAADDTALIGLQKASSVEEGQEDRLVTIENNFGQTATQITIQLTPPSRSEGYLLINGSNVGDSYQFTLQSGAQQDVSACFTADGNGVPAAATFNTTFSATDSTISGELVERSVPIVDNKTESTNC